MLNYSPTFLYSHNSRCSVLITFEKLSTHKLLIPWLFWSPATTPATHVKLSTFIVAACDLLVLQCRGRMWHNKTSFYFILGGFSLCLISSCQPQLHKAVMREHSSGNLSHAELCDFRIHFSVTAPLAVTPSVSCDNSSALQGHIKLLQGRLFYVLFSHAITHRLHVQENHLSLPVPAALFWQKSVTTKVLDVRAFMKAK